MGEFIRLYLEFPAMVFLLRVSVSYHGIVIAIPIVECQVPAGPEIVQRFQRTVGKFKRLLVEHSHKYNC